MRYLLACLLLLSWLPLTAPAIEYDDKQSLTADEIISKHLEAAGGKEALCKFQSRIAVGTVKKENEPEAQMAIVSESPNRVSAVFVFSKYDWQLTYDGTRSFIRPSCPVTFLQYRTSIRKSFPPG